jgi:hypothetical protein
MVGRREGLANWTVWVALVASFRQGDSGSPSF